MSATRFGDTRESTNTLFSVLSNHRRRYALKACQEAEGEVTLSDVAEQVAAWEYSKSIAELTSTERKRVYTSLQQHHLSQLEEAGLIEWEHDRISITPKAENLQVYLDVVPAKNIPWSLYYLSLSVIGAFTLTIAYVEWLPEQITPYMLAATFVLVFFVSALVHVHQSRSMRFDTAAMEPSPTEESE